MVVIHIAIEGSYAGYILIADVVKSQAENAVAALKTLGVRKTIMLTGDNSFTANAIAAKAGIEQVISDVLPQDKAQVISDLRSQG